MMINEISKKAMFNRLVRVEGQLRGVQRLIGDENMDCEKIVQQMAAARKALDKSAHVMLGCMIEHSLKHGDPSEAGDLGELICKYA